jgi:aspartate aminotransferase
MRELYKYEFTPVLAYRDENGAPWVLPVVRDAEQALAIDTSLDHEYLPVLGFEPFTRAACRLLLGDECAQTFDEDRVSQNLCSLEGICFNCPRMAQVFGIQCLSGTGTLKVAADFLSRILGRTCVYVSDPTWFSHNMIFKQAGFVDVKTYRYWNAHTRSLDFAGMCEDLIVGISRETEMNVYIIVVGGAKICRSSARLRTQSNRMRSNA